MTPLDSFILAAGLIVEVWAVRLAWRSEVKTLKWFFMYLIAESLSQTVTLFLVSKASAAYFYVYYLPTVGEYLLAGAVAVELSASLVSRHRAAILRLGPGIIALSAFCTLIADGHFRTPITYVRLSEIAVCLSLILMCFSIAGADAGARTGRIARGYGVLLGLVLGAMEMLARLGTGSTGARLLLPLSWVSGIAVMVWALTSKRDETGAVINQDTLELS